MDKLNIKSNENRAQYKMTFNIKAWKQSWLADRKRAFHELSFNSLYCKVDTAFRLRHAMSSWILFRNGIITQPTVTSLEFLRESCEFLSHHKHSLLLNLIYDRFVPFCTFNLLTSTKISPMSNSIFFQPFQSQIFHLC